MPDNICTCGGLRFRHLPIVVLSSVLSTEAKLAKIDRSIKYQSVPHDLKLIPGLLEDALREYRNALLNEIDCLGWAIVTEGYSLKIVPCWSGRNRPTSSKYFCEFPRAISDAYSRLMYIAGLFPKGAERAVSQFESLINEKHTQEADIQKFFEIHPEFLLSSSYDSYWSQPSLPTWNSRRLRPDFILQPRALRHLGSNWQIVDLKRPQSPVVNRRTFHRDLSHQVYNVVTQLRNYAEFFSDPRNSEYLKRRFGGVRPQPKLTAIIGRLPEAELDDYVKLMKRVPDVQITTYDEILEWRRMSMRRFT